MLLDTQNQFSAAQALSGAGTIVSTNTIDLLQDRDIGIGTPLAVVIFTIVGMTGTAGTFQATVQAAATGDAAFGSPVTVAQGAQVAQATMVAQYRQIIVIPPDTLTDRYLRLSYVLGGTTPAVTVTAYLQPLSAIQNDGLFPVGTKIS